MKSRHSQAALQAWFIAHISDLVGSEQNAIDIHMPFSSYGLSSKDAVILAGELEVWLKQQLSPTLIYEYPNIEALAQYLAQAPESCGDSATQSASRQSSVNANRSTEAEPIAIIGIGCRFPGAENPQAFWQLLRNGVDAITEVPQERWDVSAFYDPDPMVPGKTSTRWGGFLKQIEQFDLSAFGITPREAVRMDPQQRLLLEVAWEALEDAGQVLDSLAGSQTGVFIGISSSDYGQFQLSDPNLSDSYVGTGNAFSIAANRLSYVFGFRGPSMAVDTACSSTLVATHLACNSLRYGECTLALVGGVNLILSPTLTVNFSKAGFMAPDGRCKAFDAEANGYVRSEGAGVVILKPLSQALTDGDPVYAVIRGSAVNQDGHTNGLTAPSRQAQESVLHQAYQRAGVSPGQIQHIEAHGTGTALGDPIEALALGAVLAIDRAPDHKCALGSVKTNIGHLEAAAGIAGLIKVALSLKHREIPPSLHFKQPNPYIPFDILPLYVQQDLTPWPEDNQPALAGVSSFGFGGTNAHVVLEEAPRIPQIPLDNEELEANQAHLLLLSARSPQALQALASKYQAFLSTQWSDTGFTLQDICYTASVRRTHHDHRLAVVGHSHTQLAEHLSTYLQGTPSPNISSGRVLSGRQPKLVFVFSGQGSQWLGMGRTLLQQEPVFCAALQECDEHLRQYTDWSILNELMAEPPYWRLQETELAQPVLFAFQIALVALLRSWGIEPDAVVGHGLGEVAAAYVAGILRLPDAVQVVFHRSRLMQRVTEHGQTTEAMPNELVQALQGLDLQPATLPIFSMVTGQACTGEEYDASYWERNMREPARLAEAIESLIKEEHRGFLEISPHPILANAIAERLSLLDKEGIVLACLRRDKDERETLLETLGKCHSQGYSVNWTNLYLWGGQYVPLPTYAWQRERYWLEETGPGQQKTVMSISQASGSGRQGNEQQPVQKTKLICLLEAASLRERCDLLIAHIQGEVAKVVGRDPEPQQGFFEMGMDSIMTIELKNRLQKSLGLSLSPTLAFDYPNISALAMYLVGDMLSLESATPTVQVQPTRLAAEDPIAIIGLGCRFPGGANESEAFWQILRNGVDGITEIPPQRWNVDEFYDPDPDAPKKMYTRHGGFLDTEVDKFDAKFFGIAPREAVSMDPQQRLLLEVSWEALENAGQVLDKMAGSKTGVFVGINTYDYLELVKADDSTNINAYAATGNTASIAAGRLSYFLGLQGPCIALDTACSSSLVTVHLACQSLRKGECNMALAGGVNLILSPGTTIAMTKLRALSPDGHCKTFDASADGYGRGEGCGVVVLKRLSDAIADGDPILALIRGSAVNQDGRSSGLTVPNGLAQQTLIREALAVAKVEPYEVSYVDAHGTGTPLGDPIELQALNAVLGQGHTKDHPLMVGSVKTNIGHLEAAAGVAGIIKVVLALQHEEIPPHLHLKEPSPYIPWDEIPVSIPTELTPWPAGNERRIAGVSSFGFGGTNAHVVLEEAPRIPQISLNNEERDADQAHVLLLSARSFQALRALACKYQTFLATQWSDAGFPLQDICYTASVRRTHHDHRLAIVGRSHAQLAESLSTYLQGTPSPSVSSGRIPPSRQPKLVFVFSSQGSQWLGMGRTLLQQEPVFRAALQECDKQLRQYTDWSILDELMAEPPHWRLQETELAQPILFAFQIALVALWHSWGIKPDAVVGHSLGEVAAAYVAGILRLPDAVRVVFHRSRLMQRATGQGKMAQVELPLQGELVQALQGLDVQSATLPIFSTVTGQACTGEEYDASYWGRNIREPVRFVEAIESLIKEEHKVFLEISPHPVLTGAISRCFSHLDKEGTVLDCLRRDKGERDTLLKTLSKCYSLGYPINWASIYHQRKRCVLLPIYTWQRERYWVEIKHAHTSRSDVLPVPHKHDVGQDRTNDCLYDIVWQPKTHLKPSHSSAQSQTDQHGKWLIFADQGGIGAELAVLLEKRGHGCSLVYPGERYEVLTTLGGLSETDARSWHINPANPEDFQRLFRELLLIDEHPYHNVVYLWSLETVPPLETTLASLEEAQVLGCAGVLHLVQALTNTTWYESSHLWLISRGVQPAGAGAKPLNVALAPLWGIGKVIALEHPDLWGGLIDLDHDAGQQEAQMLLAEILEPDGEDQVAFRREKRYVSRLIQNNRLDITSEALSWRTDATYLITGGLGSLGLKMANWMVEQGARHLMLTGRQGLPDRSTWKTVQHDGEVAQKISAIQAMEAHGATIHPLQVDVTELQQMAAALEPLGHAQPPLRGIIHAAGILKLQTIQEMDFNTLKSVLKSKVAGTWVLHQLTQDMNLDFFVSFSSAASVWGSAQAGHYVAANHFLDIFAHYRHALGLPASSINWGWWEDSNMVPPEGKKYFEAIGLDTIPQDQGLEALGYLIKANVVQKTVAAVNWSRYKAVFEVKRKHPFLELIETQSSNARDTPSAEGMQLMCHLEQTPPCQRLAVLVDYIRAVVAQVMGLDPSYTFEPEQGFFQLGMDSLMAVELKSSLETRLGYTLPSTIAFEYPTIEAIANYLANKVLLLNEYKSPNEELEEDPMSHQIKLDEAIAELEGSSEDDLIALLADELTKLDDRRSR